MGPEERLRERPGRVADEPEPADTALELESEKLADEEEDLRVSGMLSDRRQLVTLAVVFVAGVVGIYFLAPKVLGLDDELKRIGDADLVWVAVAIAFNIAAFAAYMALFRGVLGGTEDNEVRRRLDRAASYQITMAGLAATRIFSAGGAGGIVLTYWALRKAGMPRRRSACRMVAFLVLTYSVYLFALVLFGVLLRTGVLPGDNPVGGTIVPAAIGFGALVILGLVALIPGDFERRLRVVFARVPARALRPEAGHRPGHSGHGRAHRHRLHAPPEPRRPRRVRGRGLLGGQHRHAVGELRGVRRRRPVRGARPGLLRRDGRQPDPVAGGRRRIGRRRHDRRVRAVRRAQRDRVPGRAHLPDDRLLAADPARHRGLLPAPPHRHAVGARASRRYTSESKVQRRRIDRRPPDRERDHHRQWPCRATRLRFTPRAPT